MTTALLDKQMRKGMVSIILPAYNAAAYVAGAIDSVLAQTYKNIEIIVIDDGSHDSTKAIVERYVAEHDNVHYFYQNNAGSSAARNNGMRNACGEFIAFLDADDIFLPEKIERQVDFLHAHPLCDVCYCAIWHFNEGDPDHLQYRSYHFYSGKDFLPHFLRVMSVNPLSVVMRRSIVDRWGFFNEEYRYSEDWEYFLRIAWHGAQFYFLDEKLAKYRVSPTSKSYRPDMEVLRKKIILDIFQDLQSKMTSVERWEFHMGRVIFVHRLKYFYAVLAKRVDLMRKLHLWSQNRRFE